VLFYDINKRTLKKRPELALSEHTQPDFLRPIEIG